MEDHLIIGVDISNGKSISALTVARHCKGNIEIVNQFYDEEAEELYYKLINIHYPDIEEIKNKAIAKSMVSMNNLYSHQELLEFIERTKALKYYTEKEKNYILENNTPRKIREMLAYFWLTHTNDEFFNYFGFNWVPPIRLKEKMQKQINNVDMQSINIKIPFLKPADIESVIASREILKNIEEKLTISSVIDPKIFIRGATNE